MEEKGYIEIKIEGIKNNKKIGPEDIDISEIKELLTDFENLLYPSKAEKIDRPSISYQIEKGSVRHKFLVPITSVLMFNGIVSETSFRNSIEFLDSKRAAILEKFQKKAKEQSFEIVLSTSLHDSKPLIINKQTNFFKTKSDWVDTEIYLYGDIYEEGGLSNANIHLRSKEYGKIAIKATEQQLKEGENRLYKVYGVKARGKINLIDNSLADLELIEFLDYNPIFNKSELDILISKSTPQWADVKNVDEWLGEIRGQHE